MGTQFSFIHIDEDMVRKEISLLDASKASPITSIPPNIIKKIFERLIFYQINKYMEPYVVLERIWELKIAYFFYLRDGENAFSKGQNQCQLQLWFEILFSIPQRSILGTLFFNIENSDLFLLEIESDTSNYADDNSPFS